MPRLSPVIGLRYLSNVHLMTAADVISENRLPANGTWADRLEIGVLGRVEEGTEFVETHDTSVACGGKRTVRIAY